MIAITYRISKLHESWLKKIVVGYTMPIRFKFMIYAIQNFSNVKISFSYEAI